MHAAARTGRLQRTFFIALLIVGILPGMVALWATYHSSTATLKQAIGEGFQEIARSTAIRLATAVDDEIDRTAHLASTLAATHTQETATANTDSERWQVPAPRNRQMAPGSISPGWLDTWARESRHYARVTVTDAQGLVIASTDPTLTARQDDQTWWREAMQAKPGMAYVSTVVPDPRNSEAVFHIAVPLVGDPSGTTIGIVDVVVHRSLLTHMILPIHIGNTGHAMLLDTQGTPLICPVLPPTAHLIPSGLMSRLATDHFDGCV